MSDQHAGGGVFSGGWFNSTFKGHPPAAGSGAAATPAVPKAVGKAGDVKRGVME